MKKLFFIAYIVAAFYMFFLLNPLIKSAKSIKKNGEVDNADSLKKTTMLFLLLSLLLVSFHFYAAAILNIPEGNYSISCTFEVDGDQNKYSVPAEIQCSQEVETTYRGQEEHIEKIYRVFHLLHVTPPEIHTEDFTLEYIEGLPDIIESNKSYEIDVYGQQLDGYASDGTPITLGGYITGRLYFPPLTRENLGLTLEKQLHSYGFIGLVEHIVLFLLACIELVLYVYINIRHDKIVTNNLENHKHEF